MPSVVAVPQPSTSRATERKTTGELSPRAMGREAARILAAKGIDASPATIRRLVTRFMRDGITTLAAIEPYVLAYADPTGETAVRNVLRGQVSC